MVDLQNWDSQLDIYITSIVGSVIAKALATDRPPSHPCWLMAGLVDISCSLDRRIRECGIKAMIS